MLISGTDKNLSNRGYHSDHLGLMLIFAIIVHAIIILGISFGGFKLHKKNNINPTMEVTLVKTRSETKPDKADFLAQANQKGSGNTKIKVRPENQVVPLIPDNTAQVSNPIPSVVSTPVPKRTTREELMTLKKSDETIVADVKQEKKVKSKKISAAQLIGQAKKIASLDAELGQRMKAFAKMPRNKYITTATKEYKYASYMESWRRKVEKIGNLNFPEEARRHNLSGSLILDVAINQDGTIRDITVARSSGHKILDDAAKRIVHLAAPFAPLPADIRREVDVLHIARTWKFLGNDLIASP